MIRAVVVVVVIIITAVADFSNRGSGKEVSICNAAAEDTWESALSERECHVTYVAWFRWWLLGNGGVSAWRVRGCMLNVDGWDSVAERGIDMAARA